MADTLILIVGVVSGISLVALLSWRELSRARDRRIPRRWERALIALVLVFAISAIVRMTEVLNR